MGAGEEVVNEKMSEGVKKRKLCQESVSSPRHK